MRLIHRSSSLAIRIWEQFQIGSIIYLFVGWFLFCRRRLLLEYVRLTICPVVSNGRQPPRAYTVASEARKAAPDAFRFSYRRDYVYWQQQ